jgi:FemAB-related protein (PEP-CTERM system-associated)
MRHDLPTGVVIRELTDERAAEWDTFVARCGNATFFHRVGWRRVIAESFGHDTYYLFAERDGAICGVLPLVHVASRVFGNALISTAFCVYGGPATLDEAAGAALDDAALALMARLGVDSLEYRQLARTHADWPCKEDLYATFRRTIDRDPDINLKAIPRKQRAVIRQSLTYGLTIDEDAEIDTFFSLYAASVRNLGTPVFVKRYFRNLKREFGADCEVLIARHEGKPVCTVMTFYFRDEVLPYYAGATPAARSLAAYDFVYWHLMREAGLRGLKIFDFGRSKRGTGAFAFKKNWGFTPQPIVHEYRLRDGCAIPDINPLNPRYRLFIAAWKRLPLPIANRLGPLISRDLG